jgi:hypothetical protein
MRLALLDTTGFMPRGDSVSAYVLPKKRGGTDRDQKAEIELPRGIKPVVSAHDLSLGVRFSWKQPGWSKAFGLVPPDTQCISNPVYIVEPRGNQSDLKNAFVIEANGAKAFVIRG